MENQNEIQKKVGLELGSLVRCFSEYGGRARDKIRKTPGEERAQL